MQGVTYHFTEDDLSEMEREQEVDVRRALVCGFLTGGFFTLGVVFFILLVWWALS